MSEQTDFWKIINIFRQKLLFSYRLCYVLVINLHRVYTESCQVLENVFRILSISIYLPSLSHSVDCPPTLSETLRRSCYCRWPFPLPEQINSASPHTPTFSRSKLPTWSVFLNTEWHFVIWHIIIYDTFYQRMWALIGCAASYSIACFLKPTHVRIDVLGDQQLCANDKTEQNLGRIFFLNTLI